MFEIAFLKAVSELNNAISLGSLFHSVVIVLMEWVEGILEISPPL